MDNIQFETIQFVRFERLMNKFTNAARESEPAQVLTALLVYNAAQQNAAKIERRLPGWQSDFDEAAERLEAAERAAQQTGEAVKEANRAMAELTRQPAAAGRSLVHNVPNEANQYFPPGGYDIGQELDLGEQLEQAKKQHEAAKIELNFARNDEKKARLKLDNAGRLLSRLQQIERPDVGPLTELLEA